MNFSKSIELLPGYLDIKWFEMKETKTDLEIYLETIIILLPGIMIILYLILRELKLI
jgi:hypothetical protein